MRLTRLADLLAGSEQPRLVLGDLNAVAAEDADGTLADAATVHRNAGEPEPADRGADLRRRPRRPPGAAVIQPREMRSQPVVGFQVASVHSIELLSPIPKSRAAQ